MVEGSASGGELVSTRMVGPALRTGVSRRAPQKIDSFLTANDDTVQIAAAA